MSIIEASGNTKLLAITESYDPQLWGEITSNGIAWQKYGSTMGNSTRGGEAAVLVAEYNGGIYPLFDPWSSASGGFSLPFFRLHGGQGERAVEAEVNDGYIYLLQKFPPGAEKPTLVVEKFRIEKTDLNGIDDTLTAGTQSIGWESSSSLLEDYGQGNIWAKFQSDYNFFEEFGGYADERGEDVVVGVPTGVVQRPNKFKAKNADYITNFNPLLDVLEIDLGSFGIGSTATIGFGVSKKHIKKKLSGKSFDFLYDQRRGGLYFNENGSGRGLGDGGIIALFVGSPRLGVDNFGFI